MSNSASAGTQQQVDVHMAESAGHVSRQPEELFEAAAKGDIHFFEELPEQQHLQALSLRNEDGRSLLHVAAAAGNAHVLSHLLFLEQDQFSLPLSGKSLFCPRSLKIAFLTSCGNWRFSGQLPSMPFSLSHSHATFSNPHHLYVGQGRTFGGHQLCLENK